MKSQQTGGNGGHNVSLPSQYFGEVNKNYFPEGAVELGNNFNREQNTFGYDLTPGSRAIVSSGIQTGGKKARKTKKGNMRMRKTVKKGGFLPELLNIAGSLVVPVAFLAGRQFLVEYNEKKGELEIKPHKSAKKGSK
jgi:hypothetical protein